MAIDSYARRVFWDVYNEKMALLRQDSLGQPFDGKRYEYLLGEEALRAGQWCLMNGTTEVFDSRGVPLVPPPDTKADKFFQKIKNWFKSFPNFRVVDDETLQREQEQTPQGQADLASVNDRFAVMYQEANRAELEERRAQREIFLQAERDRAEAQVARQARINAEQHFNEVGLAEAPIRQRRANQVQAPQQGDGIFEGADVLAPAYAPQQVQLSGEEISEGDPLGALDAQAAANLLAQAHPEGDPMASGEGAPAEGSAVHADASEGEIRVDAPLVDPNETPEGAFVPQGA